MTTKRLGSLASILLLALASRRSQARRLRGTATETATALRRAIPRTPRRARKRRIRRRRLRAVARHRTAVHRPASSRPAQPRRATSRRPARPEGDGVERYLHVQRLQCRDRADRGQERRFQAVRQQHDRHSDRESTGRARGHAGLRPRQQPAAQGLGLPETPLRGCPCREELLDG